MTIKNPNILNFATASFAQAMDTIRCGFELETQSFEGKTYSDYEEQRGDDSDYYDEDDMDSLSPMEYFVNGDHFSDLCWRHHIILCADGSVRGPEVKTDGPKSAKEFIQLSKLVFSKNVEVDAQCSFHIHLSLPDVRHQYSQKFQMHIIEGILLQLDKVPESVMERWQHTSWMNDYFTLNRLHRDKYQFVAHRHSYNTWEFRCWGNVQNAKDAAKCLLISVRALQFAYKVALGLEKSMFDVDSWHKDSVGKVIQEKVFSDGHPMVTACYPSRIVAKSRRRAAHHNNVSLDDIVNF